MAQLMRSSRRGRSPHDDPEDPEDDADDYFDAKLFHAYISDSESNLTARIYLHEGEYEEDDLILGRYLETLRRPITSQINNFNNYRRNLENS